MRTFLLIFLFITVPLAGGSLKPELETEFWKDSGADVKLLKSVINDKDCAGGEKYFDACRAAVLKGAELRDLSGESAITKLKATAYPQAYGFESALDFILQKQNGQPVEWIIGSMINAQIKTFDPYAQLNPKLFLRSRINGDNNTYYGTGIEGDANAAGLFVFRIFPDSPAALAGIQVHDRIVSINGESLDTLSKAHSALPRLNGTPGESLKLIVERKGQRTALTLKVAPIVVPENPAAEFIRDRSRYLQVRLRSFHRGTCDFLRKRITASQALSSEPLAGVILDLRHNRGGLVDESECVVRLFTAQRLIVTREHLNLPFPKALDFEPAHWPDDSLRRAAAAPFANLPLVVLMNAKSASASEIAAAALQDYARAWIIGERSYGKGTTQFVNNLEGYPNLTITKTVSRYLRPSGESVHRNGILPNLNVPSTLGAQATERRFVREENLVSSLQLVDQARAQESRPLQVAELRKCLRKDQSILLSEAIIQRRLGYLDHQAAVALAALSCGQI